MFGWRKRSEGFEWQEYVRTTILVRRADRQRRVDDVRTAALAKVQHAKERGIEAGKAGIDHAADQAARAAKATGRTAGELAVAGAQAIGRFLQSAYDVVVKIITPYLPERKAPPAGAERPVHARFADKRAERPDRPRATPREAHAPRRLTPDVGPNGRLAIGYAMRAAAAVVVVLAVGHMLQGGGDGIETGSVTRAATITAEPVELSGRATAVAGDALRINAQLVRLKGVIAPEENQPCFTDSGKRYLCSVTARKALDRLVRGKRVSCVPSGSGDDGVALATCDVDGEDLAQNLTRAGHVFAQSGLFASYASDETAAREDRAGLWQGETVRPEDWRSRVWEEAKRTAPDGCPIKGVVRGGVSIYAMPWSSDYSGARFRSGKAERWFCSEQEARDAGFQPALKS